MEYKIARSYEEQGYTIIDETVHEENGKLYGDISCQCWKCGGKGKIAYFGHIDNGVCFTCGGWCWFWCLRDVFQ